VKLAACGVVNPDDQQPQSPLWSCSNKVGLMSCWIMRINVEDWWQDLTLRNTGGMRAGFEGSIIGFVHLSNGRQGSSEAARRRFVRIVSQ